MAQQLVLLETAGNQRYIFATNKLRENVGASELTYRAGKSWVEDAAEGKPELTVILPTSGKAYLLAESEDAARKVISEVTRKALREAPGLDLSGVFVPVEAGGVHDAIQKAHKLLASRRGTNPGIEARFRRLPVVAECATSGMSANVYDTTKPEPGPRSFVSVKKREVAQAGIDRMRQDWNILRSADHFDRVETKPWLAVVHADGNGLGQVFLDFQTHAKSTGATDYTAKLQQFSHALDRCTERAFGFALEQLAERCDESPLPVVPIVLGGDDMTVVMDGKYAVQFTIDYLEQFEELTGKDDTIEPIVGGAVTACAGVAVVKPHFPFHAAYELAEALIKSAKVYAKGIDEKKPPSAFDFHILYDASGPDLKRIRESLRATDGVTELIARPYLVSDDATNRRSTATLDARMAAIQPKDEDGRRAIPNSQLHDLRTALFLGREAATARYELVRERYEEFKALLPDGLFWEDGDQQRTHLLDAIDLFAFWHTDGGRL